MRRATLSVLPRALFLLVVAGTLRDEVDQDFVDGWVGIVTRTMAPTRVGLWVRS
jgi:hypothetical protein